MKLLEDKTDIQQSVGRILRQKNDIPPLVVDFVDKFSLFENQGRKRLTFYNKQGELLSPKLGDLMTLIGMHGQKKQHFNQFPIMFKYRILTETDLVTLEREEFSKVIDELEVIRPKMTEKELIENKIIENIA